MLIKAAFENFKSFSRPAEFSLVSSAKIRSHSNHKHAVSGANVLKHAVIFGANGSGKSNLAGFFLLMQDIVRNGFTGAHAWSCSKVSPQSQNKPSSFCVQFSIGKDAFEYGFQAILYQKEPVSEWLYELKADGSRRLLFSIEAASGYALKTGGRLRRGLDQNTRERTRFEVYAADYASAPAHFQLFLSVLAAKPIQEDSPLALFKTVFSWFSDHLKILRPAALNPCVLKEPVDPAALGLFLAAFDTGIQSADLQKISLQQLPESALLLLKGQLQNPNSLLNQPDEQSVSSQPGRPLKENTFAIRTNEGYYTVTGTAPSGFQVHELVFRHFEDALPFHLRDESAGTRTLLELFPLLAPKNPDQTWIVDDFGLHLHPNAARAFLECFLRKNDSYNSQLILTTHLPALLDQELFRRDEFWLVEKKAGQGSILYPLDTFKMRHDKLLAKDYLDGRYGAVPNLLPLDPEEGRR